MTGVIKYSTLVFSCYGMALKIAEQLVGYISM